MAPISATIPAGTFDFRRNETTPSVKEEGTTHSERQASRLAKPALIDVKGGNIPNCGSPKQKRIEDRQRGPICRPKSGSRTTRGASYSFLNMENNSEAFTEHARTENRHESVTEQKFFDFQEQVISAVQDVCSSNDEIQQSWKTHRENSDTRIREFDTNLRNRIEEVCLNFKKTFSAQEAAWSAKLAEVEARRADREFEGKKRLFEKAWSRVCENMKRADSSAHTRYSPAAQNDALKCDMRAETLEGVAGDCLRRLISSKPDLSKQEKHAMFPYIKAMTSATIARATCREITSCSTTDEAERAETLEEENGSLISDCVSSVHSAIMKTISGTSLLEMAVDYNILLEKYFELIKDLRAYESTMLVEGEWPRSDTQWDDGLSSLRKLLDTEASTGDGENGGHIELNTTKHSLWWSGFNGEKDPLSLPAKDLRKKIELRELLLVLGAGQDDDTLDNDAAAIRLAPGYMDKLLELEPAEKLRTGLIDKLAAKLDKKPGSSVLDSVARIRNERNIRPPFLKAPLASSSC